MISLFLLVGCSAGGGERGAGGEELAFAIRREYADLTGWSGRFHLTADYGQRVFTCVLDGTWDRDGGMTLTMVQPEMAQGVTARIAQGERQLSYDGFSLDAGPVTGDGLTPVEAVPLLLEQIQTGYIARAELREGELEMICREGDAPAGSGLEVQAVFDPDTHALLSGELSRDGVMAVAIQVEDFQSMGPGTGD